MKKAFSFLPSFFKIDRQIVSTDERTSDKESLNTVRQYVTQWCILNKFLIPSRNDSYVPNINPNEMDNQLRDYIYSLNFKRLCIDSYLQDLLSRLQDTEHDKTTTRLVDLHIQIMTDVDPRFINLYINKLIHTLSEIYPDDNVDHTWQDIFEQLPYLWLIYVIQNIMRFATPPP